MVKNSKLTNHIKAVHKNEPLVLDAIESDNMKKMFADFKIQGILNFNTKEAASANPFFSKRKKRK